MGDITRSSESVTGETEETPNEDGEKVFGDDAPRSSESVTGETEDGADEERDSTTEPITGETEDSCFVTGDASGDLKIPLTSSCAAVISSSLSSTASSRRSLSSTSVLFSTVASGKTGVSCSRSRRSSFSISKLLLS